MTKPKIFSDWLQGNNSYFNEYDLKNHMFKKPVEIYVDTFPDSEKNNDITRFLLLVEPIELSGSKTLVLDKSHLFDYILTYEDFFLGSIKNSIKFEYGTTWIDYNKIIQSNKNFSVSSVFSSKRGLLGYEIRNGVYKNKDKFVIPTNFFNGTGFNDSEFQNLGEFKNPLFSSMFHICIENVKKENFFTEKLIDCLISKTIPIYYGCPNINDYFNCDGIYVAESVEDILKICNSLTEETYFEKVKYINENFEKSKKYCDFRKRITDKIEEIIN